MENLHTSNTEKRYFKTKSDTDYNFDRLESNQANSSGKLIELGAYGGTAID